MNFSDVLSGAGYALDTPRRLLYQGGDAAARGLGYQGREIKGFGDVLGEAGMDPDSMLTHALGAVGNFATDPLTWVGGLGLLKGHNALKGMAAARGPRFAGGLEKLATAGAGVADEGAAAMAALRESPYAARLAEEVPEGYRFLGGNNALAFGPAEGVAGDAVRLGREESRLAIPEMLQPTRNVKVGDWRERVPMAQDVGRKDLFAQQYKPMTQSIRDQGLHPADFHPGNLGTVEGVPKLIDPGAVVPLPGKQAARAAEMTGTTGGPWSDALLDYLGYTAALRRKLGG